MHYHHSCGPRGHHFGSFRGRGHRGFPGFGGESGSGGFGFGGFGRMFRDGGLRLVTLAILDEGPRHGYDIIKAFEEKSAGAYSPSPGVVYPTLTWLEEAGYATATADGNKKVYTITDEGRAHLTENRATVDTILTAMTHFGARMKQAKEWFDRSERGEPAERPEANQSDGELDKARRRLRGLIMAANEDTEAEQKRVADILQRASDEILGRRQ